MNRDEITIQVKTILSKRLNVSQQDIDDSTSIIDDLGAESLDIVEILIEVEEHFDIDIPKKALGRVRTLGDIIEELSRHLATES